LATAVGILHRRELATQDWRTRLTRTAGQMPTPLLVARIIQATTAWKIRQTVTSRKGLLRCGSEGGMPDIFSSGGINGVFGNVGSVIANALKAAANKDQIQVTAQLIRILRHALD
jgi:hypothetical protein